jgi:hypothetical protein
LTVNLKPKVPLSARLSPITLTEVIATAGVVSLPPPPHAANNSETMAADAAGAQERICLIDCLSKGAVRPRGPRKRTVIRFSKSDCTGAPKRSAPGQTRSFDKEL